MIRLRTFVQTTAVLLFAISTAAAQTPCSIGVATVACEVSLRTIVVAKSGTANYRTIQEAINAARAGDTILVRAGVYNEPVFFNATGQPNAPITLKAYAGERPVIKAVYEGKKDQVRVGGRWLIFDGFEVADSRHGIIVYGSNNIIRNNFIHDSGDVACTGADICGQGLIIASASDVAIVNNQIERNGLSSVSPWHVHGIYLSDYFNRGISKISVISNIVRDHAGAGLQIWNSSAATSEVFIANNRFENNTVEMILSRVHGALVYGNTFSHNRHPPTNAPRTAMLWLDTSYGIFFERNTFQFGLVTDSLPTALIHWYKADQPWTELTWTSNMWQLPAGYPQLTDDLISRAGR